ncbi:cytochrome P450 [Mycena leptocephala]|nr:cytochrome P450 [Mycena leptocephala]
MFALGNLAQMQDPDDSAFQQELGEKYAQVVKLHGPLGDRQLFVFDPASLHSILVKEQDVYEEPPMIIWHVTDGMSDAALILHVRLNRLFFGPAIFSAQGAEHRRYRKIMTPAFSSASLRGVIPLFYEVAQRTRDGLIAPKVLNGPQRVDLSSVLYRTSLELIGRAGIGHSFDPMLPGQDHAVQYAEALRALFPTAFEMQWGIPLFLNAVKIFPPWFLRFMIDFIPLPTLHRLRDLVDFTDSTAAELVKERKAAMELRTSGSAEEQRDIMSLLVKSNMSTEVGVPLTEEELVACTSTIVFAATDTTASSMNRVFHVLALYPDVQERLRAEILAVPEHLDHDTLLGLPYLDAVVREVLRLYPPVAPVIFRKAVVDAVLPLSVPITGVDGTLMHSITVPKGTSIYLGTVAANLNTEVWGEDALQFRPERWTNGKAESVTTKLPGVYGNTMTFSGGGRSCIGFKFAELEMKVVLCVLLRAFKFSAPAPRIQWRNTGIIPSPYIDNQPALPILVERLD